MKKGWICKNCEYVHLGETPLKVCPKCGTRDAFVPDHFDRLREIVKDRTDYNAYKTLIDEILKVFIDTFSENPGLKEEQQINELYQSFLDIYDTMNATIIELNDLPISQREIRRECFLKLGKTERELLTKIIPKIAEIYRRKGKEEKFKEILKGKGGIIEGGMRIAEIGLKITELLRNIFMKPFLLDPFYLPILKLNIHD